MAITYTWKVTGLKVQDISDTKPSAVVHCTWTKTGTDNEGREGVFAGATPFTIDPTDESGPFIPFNELTEADITSWLEQIVVGGYELHVNEKIQKQIEAKISPIIEAKLPWSDVSEPTPTQEII